MTTLSILVPVYNEQHLVAASLERLLVLETSPHLSRIQVVVVDDCSRDRTPEILKACEARFNARPDSKITWRFLRHPQNGGKGAAIRTALAQAEPARPDPGDVRSHRRTEHRDQQARRRRRLRRSLTFLAAIALGSVVAFRVVSCQESPVHEPPASPIKSG